ncbi:MAG: LptF/LptG family permease, partial [Dokdonella sp.]
MVLCIIDRYLFRELLVSLLAVGAVLLLISIGETVVAVLSQVTRGVVPAELLFTLIALRAVDSLNVLLPLAVFLGVLLAFGRLYRDSEMAVLSASGLDLAGLLRPLALLVVPMLLLMSVVSLWLGPSAVRLSLQLISDSSRSLLIAGLEPGRFVALPGQEGVIFVGAMSAEGARFERMFIETERVQDDGSSQISVITAARGELYRDTAGGERYLALEDGFRVEGTPGQDDYRLLRFARNDIRLPENEVEESPDS